MNVDYNYYKINTQICLPKQWCISMCTTQNNLVLKVTGCKVKSINVENLVFYVMWHHCVSNEASHHNTWYEML